MATMSSNSPPRLSLPVIISIIVHVALLVWILRSSMLSGAAPTSMPVLSIELSRPHAPATPEAIESQADTHKDRTRVTTPAGASTQAAKAPPRSTPQAPARGEASRTAKARQAQFEVPFLGGQAPQAQAADADTLAQQAREALRNDVVEYLNQAFRHRFVYPQQARRRGWQGRVLVHIHIDRDGRLENIEVASSSGYAILDRDAVSTFKRIGRLAPKLSARLGHNSRFAIPVIYRLTRG